MRPAKMYTGTLHAGAGSAMLLVQLAVLLPGLLPLIALTVFFGAIVVLPLAVLGLAGALLAAPPYVVWRVARRLRRRNAVV